MITDRLIFIHVYRTGGFLVRAVLREIPGLEIINDHLHVSYERMARIANEVLGRVPPAIAFTRNPYSWYVSMWGAIWIYPQIPFVGTFREYMEAVRDRTIDNPNFVTFTQNWNELGADNAAWQGRHENLADDFANAIYTFYRDEIHAWSPRTIIEAQPRFHPSLEWPSRQRTKHYSHYYDAELKGLVDDWDGELIERFGYGFENEV